MAASSQDSPVEAPALDVFICYRQVDGSETADWLHTVLQGQPIPSATKPAPRIRFYVDRYTAAGPNWREVNSAALRTARAMIVVCTPGAKVDEGPSDEVQREIRWWIRNRSVAPILIDSTGSGTRYVPKAIAERWPNAQLVEVQVSEIASQGGAVRAAFEERTVARITQGIVLSEGKVRDEDLERTRRLQRRTVIGLAVAVTASVAAGIAAYAFVQQRDEAIHLAREADRLKRTADLASLGGLILDSAATTADAAPGALLVIEALKLEQQSLQGQLAWARVLEYYPPLVTDRAVPPILQTNSGHVGAFSPDGRFFALSQEGSGQLRVLDLDSGKFVFEFGGEKDRILAVSFDSKSGLLAAGGAKGFVHVWALPNWNEITQLSLPEAVQALAFIGHGRELAAAGVSNLIQTWQVDGWKPKLSIRDPAGDALSVHFSPDGQWVATLSYHSQIYENVVRIRDLATGAAMTSYIQGDPRSMVLSRDGRYLAANGSFDEDRLREVRLFELGFNHRRRGFEATLVERYKLTATRRASMSFDPIARQLAIGSEEGVRVLWTRGARDAAKIDQIGVQSLAFVREGGALAAAGTGRVRVWDFDVGRSLARELMKSNAPLDRARFESRIRPHLSAVQDLIGRGLTIEERAKYALEGSKG
jgi:TIR domain